MFSTSVQIQDLTEWKKIVSPAVDKKNPFYRWYLYKHGYSRELVHKIIEKMELKEGQNVLDPFCGGGTTLLAAAEKGLNSTGYDIMPFATFVSNTKMLRPALQEIEKEENSFTVEEIEKITTKRTTDIITLNKAFSKTSLEFLFKFREKIEKIKNKEVKSIILLAFLKSLETISKAKKSGGFLRLTNQNPITKKRIVGNFKNMLFEMKQDLVKSKYSFTGNAKAFVGDSRTIKKNTMFDAVISSPPYPNRHDYTRVYLLEEVFGFGDTNNEIKQLRYRTLRSHVEAKKQMEPKAYKKPKELENALKKLSTKKMNNNKIIEMIEGFFEDMHITLKEIKSKLNKNGKVAFVISNARYAGVGIEADKYLLEIGKNIGFQPVGIYVLRHRGNSYQQTVNYAKDPARESLVVFTN